MRDTGPVGGVLSERHMGLVGGVLSERHRAGGLGT